VLVIREWIPWMDVVVRARNRSPFSLLRKVTAGTAGGANEQRARVCSVRDSGRLLSAPARIRGSHRLSPTAAQVPALAPDARRRTWLPYEWEAMVYP
jgi:hypothetical protein